MLCYVTNEEQHDDLTIKWVSKGIPKLATKHEKASCHTKVEVIQPWDNAQELTIPNLMNYVRVEVSLIYDRLSLN